MEKDKFYRFNNGYSGVYDLVEKEKVENVLTYMASQKMNFDEYYIAINNLYDGDYALNTIFVSWSFRLKKRYENLKKKMNI